MKLKRKKTVKNETETEKYFTTEITLCTICIYEITIPGTCHTFGYG